MTQAKRACLRREPVLIIAMLAALAAASPLDAQGRGGGPGGGRPGEPPDTTGAGGAPSLVELIASTADDSDLRIAVRRFDADRSQLFRRYDVPLSPVLIKRLRTFYDGWLARLDAFDPDELNEAGRADYAALRDEIDAGLQELAVQERDAEGIAPLVPFARPIQLLQERRRDRLDVDAQEAAQTLEDVRKDVLRLTEALEGAESNGPPPEFRSITPAAAARAVEHLDELREPLESWYEYYYGFDPLFSWWARVPYEELTEALTAYESSIRQAWSIPN